MQAIRSKTIIATCTLILLAATAFAQSASPARHFGRRGFGLGMFFHQLNLTDAQKAQIRQIMQQERPTLKPLVQQVAQGENQMRQLELSGSFNENQARTLAAQQSQNMTELMVQRARIESEMIQVLTPDQKTQLEQLIQQRAQRFSNQNQGSTTN